MHFRRISVDQELYDCIFEGEIAADTSNREVKEGLSKLFKTDPKIIDALFDRGPVIVRRGVDRETALRYEAAFKRAGATLRSVGLDEDPAEASGHSYLKEPVEGCGWLSRFLERTKTYSDLRLVVVLTLASFPLKILMSVPLVLTGVDAPDQKLDASIGTLIFIALVAPLIETLLGQWLPIKIASYFTLRPAVLVTVSTVLFSAAHGSFSLATAVFPVGLGLAWIFVIKRSESFKKAFWLTSASHALHNFIVFGLLCLGVAMEG
jgi:membrane protease YdiL (CAAX protease family)